MNTAPLIIEDTNLSHAWKRGLDHVLENSGKEITSLLISITEFSEDQDIRFRLDRSLKRDSRFSVDTVANTIFPNQLYQLCGYDRHSLYREYSNILSRLKKIEPKNARGTYFERLISYGPNINQLEIIIESFLKDPSVRRSKLQASIFDATRDHINDAYQKFPCLQHISTHITDDDRLVLNSFYAVQSMYSKAYGNWLGLINLGKFMARELNVTFDRLNCFIGVEQLDITKEKAREILV